MVNPRLMATETECPVCAGELAIAPVLIDWADVGCGGQRVCSTRCARRVLDAMERFGQTYDPVTMAALELSTDGHSSP